MPNGDTISIPVDGADPEFSAFENLIICDLVNKEPYINALLNYRIGQERFTRLIEINNVPGRTKFDEELGFSPEFEKLQIEDVIDWHLRRPWLEPDFFVDATEVEAEQAGEAIQIDPEGMYSFFLQLAEADQAEGYTALDPNNISQSIEPTIEDFAFFLRRLSILDDPEYDDPADETPRELRVRQREMLALLAERFAGLMMLGTGLRIMQSLTMFVDFTVRKDGTRNLLMW